MTERKKLRWDIWLGITICAFALFILFFVFPVYKIFVHSMYDAETKQFTLQAFKDFFERSYYTSTVWNSLKVTSLVTILAAILGTALAYVMNTVKIKGKAIVEIIVIIVVLSPPFIGAYSWILLLGRSGVISKFINNVFGIEFNGIYGFAGILLHL